METVSIYCLKCKHLDWYIDENDITFWMCHQGQSGEPNCDKYEKYEEGGELYGNTETKGV